VTSEDYVLLPHRRKLSDSRRLVPHLIKAKDTSLGLSASTFQRMVGLVIMSA